ncbi:hypothetical protein [Candidatus Electronema sp. JM]|uniref:hypothetical protein n=1 Tax=Candidatus Electronema sp. JM TaxID=3401571 RepID=UPI003AA7D21D
MEPCSSVVIAAAMAAENSNYSLEDNKTMLANLVRVIQKNLLDGTQSTIDGGRHGAGHVC